MALSPAAKRVQVAGSKLGGLLRLDSSNAEKIAAAREELTEARRAFAYEAALEEILSWPEEMRLQIAAAALGELADSKLSESDFGV